MARFLQLYVVLSIVYLGTKNSSFIYEPESTNTITKIDQRRQREVNRYRKEEKVTGVEMKRDVQLLSFLLLD